MEKKSRFKRPVTNADMAVFFFVLFIVFFFIFLANSYTINLIFSIIMLQFSLAFKTWQLIRDLRENYYG